MNLLEIRQFESVHQSNEACSVYISLNQKMFKKLFYSYRLYREDKNVIKNYYEPIFIYQMDYNWVLKDRHNYYNRYVRKEKFDELF